MSSKKKPAPKAAAKPASPSGIDADAVRELAKLLKETGLTEIEIEHDGARIRVSRAAIAAPAAAPAPVATPAAAAPVAPSAPSGPPAGAVPSPMVGTVYLSPEPGRPPFVTVGKTVKEGDTLFIIEAMLVQLNAGKNQQRRDVDGDNHRHDGHDKINDKPFGFFAGYVLSLEEVHLDLRF